MVEELDMKRIPQHIAIIMDGNGRWATERNKPRSYGHQAGVETVRRITSECTRLGVKYLTLYTFSTENWNRPSDEIAALMGLVLTSLEDEIFMKNNVRFQVIGDIKTFTCAVAEKLKETIEHTANNKCYDYGCCTKLFGTMGTYRSNKTNSNRSTKRRAESRRHRRDIINKHLCTNFMPTLIY